MTRSTRPASVLAIAQMICSTTVHCFDVDKAFKEKQATFNGGNVELQLFTGQVQGAADPERHAMVLVGMRKVGETWNFLLQNWWSDLQLVEVTGFYLETSDAKFVQAVREQLNIQEKFDRCDDYYSEVEVPGMD
jgi:hypothetical protein